MTGFPRRLEKIEYKNGHGKIMEHEKVAKSHGILLFSHGILPILSPNCTKFVYNVESPHFLMFCAKRRKCKINKKDGH